MVAKTYRAMEMIFKNLKYYIDNDAILAINHTRSIYNINTLVYMSQGLFSHFPCFCILVYVSKFLYDYFMIEVHTCT